MRLGGDCEGATEVRIAQGGLDESDEVGFIG
jgi:hypothetical protein